VVGRWRDGCHQGKLVIRPKSVPQVDQVKQSFWDGRTDNMRGKRVYMFLLSCITRSPRASRVRPKPENIRPSVPSELDQAKQTKTIRPSYVPVPSRPDVSSEKRYYNAQDNKMLGLW
jgi:hypothetical protein